MEKEWLKVYCDDRYLADQKLVYILPGEDKAKFVNYKITHWGYHDGSESETTETDISVEQALRIVCRDPKAIDLILANTTGDYSTVLPACEKRKEYEKIKNDCVLWIRRFFEENGQTCNAVIGISGGKDSSVAAALCVEALGKDRVIGVLMPQGEQHDIDCAYMLVRHLGIRHFVINIADAVNAVRKNLPRDMEITAQTVQNIPPRIRMTTLYAVSQSMNGRVCNTCNLSEDYVGYSTRYGDAAGDFSPMSHLTVTEVKEIGHLLGLPRELVEKTPIDGLCGKSDEENLGFTYAELDVYIRTGVIRDEKKKALIDQRHKANLFKLALMPSFQPEN